MLSPVINALHGPRLVDQKQTTAACRSQRRCVRCLGWAGSPCLSVCLSHLLSFSPSQQESETGLHARLADPPNAPSTVTNTICCWLDPLMVGQRRARLDRCRFREAAGGHGVASKGEHARARAPRAGPDINGKAGPGGDVRCTVSSVRHGHGLPLSARAFPGGLVVGLVVGWGMGAP